MDISASEWSSGCESGWTVYLDESSQSLNSYQRGSRKNVHDHRPSYRADYNDEEDLSMVSDASSGPAHVHYGDEEEEEVECCRLARFYHPSSSEKSKKKKAKEPRAKHQHSFLDDTASSPALSYQNRCMDPSNNHPAVDHLFSFSNGNAFTGSSRFGNQFRYWQSTHPKKQDVAEPSRSGGRRRG